MNLIFLLINSVFFHQQFFAPNKLQSDSLIILLHDNVNYQSEIKDKINGTDAKHLVIRINENFNSWVIYPIFSGSEELENIPTFSYNKKIEKLPEEIGNLLNIESLILSFLGLESMPQELMRLKKLKVLDISFNYLTFDSILEVVKSLDNLEVLKVYGCGISKDDYQKLKNQKPDLQIFYNKEHNVTEFER